MHPKASTSFTGSWHGEGGALFADETPDGTTYAFARATCDRCGQTVEGRGSTVQLAQTQLACAQVSHHCETWDIGTHTAKEARKVVRDWWRVQDPNLWRDAALTAAAVCIVALLILRAWSRW